MKKLWLCLFCTLLFSPLFAADKKHRLEFAYEGSDYTYREPHMQYPISLKGKLNGGHLRYIQHDVLNNDTNSFAVLELRYMTGATDYDGWVGTPGGTPIKETVKNVNDYYWEGRLLIGNSYELTDRLALQPYFGLGWRYLKDHMNKGGPKGYIRESTYYYLPVGTNIKLNLTENLFLVPNAEFDCFLTGRQMSRISHIYGEDVSNPQKQGWGMRFSVKLEQQLGKFSVFVEPFYRYWKIQNSDKEYIPMGGGYALVLVEPFNTTREYGIRAGFAF